MQHKIPKFIYWEKSKKLGRSKRKKQPFHFNINIFGNIYLFILQEKERERARKRRIKKKCCAIFQFLKENFFYAKHFYVYVIVIVSRNNKIKKMKII